MFFIFLLIITLSLISANYIILQTLFGHPVIRCRVCEIAEVCEERVCLVQITSHDCQGRFRIGNHKSDTVPRPDDRLPPVGVVYMKFMPLTYKEHSKILTS